MLHWHLVDSQSSPLEYFKNPIFLITQYGAYDKTKVYKQERIKELVAYANFKGERLETDNVKKMKTCIRSPIQ